MLRSLFAVDMLLVCCTGSVFSDACGVSQLAQMQLLSGCCPAVVRLLSGCCPVVVRLLSGCCPVVVQLKPCCRCGITDLVLRFISLYTALVVISVVGVLPNSSSPSYGSSHLLYRPICFSRHDELDVNVNFEASLNLRNYALVN